MTNPLLDLSALPRFSAIQPQHVSPAIQQLIDENRTLITQLCGSSSPLGWDTLVVPITNAGERLARAWGVVGHMHSVMDNPEWREAYNGVLPEVSRFYAETGHNFKLFEKYSALHTSSEFATLSPLRQHILAHELRDFRLCGAELPDSLKPRFQSMQETQSTLAAKFSENLLDATNAHAEWVEDAAVLAGLPGDVQSAAHSAAERAGKPGWKLTLQMPCYLPVMQYSENRDLRARMYRAYATRASEFGPAKLDNGPLISEILALRNEEARMLGYRHYADMSMVTKMAESTDQVLAFLRELATKAKPFAVQDLNDLHEFALTTLGLKALEPWDMTYTSEKLRQARYAFSELEVKSYFPKPKVIEGLFRVAHALYGIDIVTAAAEKWHQDVDFYRIERNGETIGHFFLDLYARETKRGGAWMDSASTRQRTAQGVQTPVAYLVCNFSGPSADKPATFTHDDVQTLFHEFGHGLHHLLTRIDELAASGIHGVEWDAVELPSQFMENFCWEWDVLSGMTAHVDTGAPLPRELFDKMVAARNFQSGMQTMRQIEFSMFDLRLHSEIDPVAGEVQIEQVLALLDEVRNEVSVIIPPIWHRFPHSFSHIFAGGYAAGYYSYKWAEVLSADAFEAFEETRVGNGSVLSTETGKRFWNEILAVGSSRPSMESFRAFRGRDPEVGALLRHNGMVTT